MKTGRGCESEKSMKKRAKSVLIHCLACERLGVLPRRPLKGWEYVSIVYLTGWLCPYCRKRLHEATAPILHLFKNPRRRE